MVQIRTHMLIIQSFAGEHRQHCVAAFYMREKLAKHPNIMKGMRDQTPCQDGVRTQHAMQSCVMNSRSDGPWKPKRKMRGKCAFCCACLCAVCAGGILITLAYEATRWPLSSFVSTGSRGDEHFYHFHAAGDKLSPDGGPCATNELVAARAVQNMSVSSPYNLGTGCPRSFSLPRSVIGEEGAARVRCTSSFSNTVRMGRRCRRDRVSRTETYSPASICVFHLNYRNADNLLTSVKSHAMRAHNPDLVSHTVLTMDEDEGKVNATRHAMRMLADVHRFTFPPGTRGGEPLPIALRLISLLSACPLTVVSDSDAFMLADGWDLQLMTRFLDPQMSLFAANPRHSSHGAAFRDVAEWNWMAFRTQSFVGLVIGGSGSVALPDVGHYFTECAKSMNAGHVHLQGTLWPYEGKAATVVTDTDGAPWILHLFYSSRHNNEPDAIKSEARKYSLTDAQLAELRINVTRTRCLDPAEAFGLTKPLSEDSTYGNSRRRGQLETL